MSKSICKDCHTDLDPIPLGVGVAEYFYLVRDELWRAAGMSTSWGNFLCIGCLEQRLGRELEGADFKADTPVNRPQRQDTARLAARKAKQAWPGAHTPLLFPFISDPDDLPPQQNQFDRTQALLPNRAARRRRAPKQLNRRNRKR